MGQAKNKRLARAAAGLPPLTAEPTDTEKHIIRCATNLFEKHLAPSRRLGACYFATFLLHYHLLVRHGITTQPTVGYVNDTKDSLWASHGWLVHSDRTTDLAIHLPLDPSLQLPGHARIHGKVIRRGVVDYRYAMEPPEDAMTWAQMVAGFDDPAQRRHFQKVADDNIAQHERMKGLSRSIPEEIRAYLDGSPGPTYDELAKLMD